MPERKTPSETYHLPTTTTPQPTPETVLAVPSENPIKGGGGGWGGVPKKGSLRGTVVFHTKWRGGVGVGELVGGGGPKRFGNAKTHASANVA